MTVWAKLAESVLALIVGFLDLFRTEESKQAGRNEVKVKVDDQVIADDAAVAAAQRDAALRDQLRRDRDRLP